MILGTLTGAKITSEANPVIKINSLSENKWFRKPAGARRGPWYSGEYSFIDKETWGKNSPCIYFVFNDSDDLKYVGISQNKLKDRWRLSPAYSSSLVSLNRKEIFHSQCWPQICAQYNEGYKGGYLISVVHAIDLPNLMSKIGHSNGSKENIEVDISMLETWFIKNYGKQLWNKRL